MNINDFILFVNNSIVPAQMTSCFIFKNKILKVDISDNLWTIYKPVNDINNNFTHHQHIADLNTITQVITNINGNNEFEQLFN